MNELTMLLFMLTVGLFVVSIIVKKNPINWLTFFVSICSVCQSISDMTLDDTDMVILIVPTFYILLMSGWSSFTKGTD